MKLTVALTTLLAIAVVAQVEIVGGKEATAGKHLYVTGLRQTTTASDQCGGSLIAPNVVLTAAHCTGHGLKYASIGSHFLSGSKDGEQIKVIKEIKNPKNNANTNSFDFAVLLLERNSTIPPCKSPLTISLVVYRQLFVAGEPHRLVARSLQCCWKLASTLWQTQSVHNSCLVSLST
ncbi:unnamed protein product [Aphanomyces euteiches]